MNTFVLHSEPMNKNAYKVLIVDDEPDILEFIEYNLLKEGYDVYKAVNGNDTLKLLQNTNPHLILLDVMMPGMDGFEVCRKIRSNSKFDDVLIAFLTAKREDLSQISGLDAGADDYISKPIKPKVLMSRVAALLRRLPSEVQSIIDLGDIIINKEEFTVTVHGKQLILPRKEFELLLLLSSKPGKVFTREEIYKKIWGSDLIVGVRTIDVHIRKVREKIGDKFITTIKGIGYKFVV